MTTIIRYLNKKAQGIVEYALLLAFIVGLGMTLNGVGIKDSVINVFDDVATLLSGGEGTSYAAAFAKMSQLSKSELINSFSPDERLAADQAALDNIAKTFYRLKRDEVAALTGQDIGTGKNNKNFFGTEDGSNSLEKADIKQQTSTLFLNYSDNDTNNGKTNVG